MKRTLLFLSLILGITFNLFAAGTYIIDVAVSSASTKSKAQSQLTDKGYHVVDKDANAGASGNFVYIGYKTNEDDPDGDPVCDLFVLDADKAKAYYEGSYTIDYINDDGNKIMYSQVVSFGNKNLNDGCSGADALVLYFARSGAPAITDIGLSKNKKSGDNIYIAQMMDFDDNLDFIWDGDADLNKTAGGEDLWLWFERPEGEIIQEHTWVNGFCECGAYQEPSIKNNTEYQITNAGNLYWYVQNITDETMTAVLTTNITVNSNVLTSSDTLNTSKASSFREWILSEKELTIEGNNHTISGLYFKDASVNGVGLLVNGTVKNLGVVDSYFEGRDYVGAICGTGSETIENCYSKAVVKGEKYVGGICGKGNAKGCYNSGNVTGKKYVGGICGEGYSIAACYNTGNVTGTGGVGGICGGDGWCAISECYNSGSIIGVSISSEESAYSIGGIGGDVNSVINCYNLGTVSSEQNAGGLVGRCTYDGIKNSYNKGSVVSKENQFGNIVSENANDYDLSSCYYLSSLPEGGEGNATPMDEEAFENGSLALSLHKFSDGTSNGSVWGQMLKTDKYPTFCGEISGDLPSFSVNVEVEGEGTVTGTGTYSPGDKVKLVATPSQVNYLFRGWSDGVMDNVRYVYEQTDLKAIFTPAFAVVYVESDGNGTVGGDGIYESDEKVNASFTIEAYPNEGYGFDYVFVKDTKGYLNGEKGTLNQVAHLTKDPLTSNDAVVLDDTIWCTVHFVLDSFVVSVEAKGEGVVTGKGNYYYGTTVTLTATPKDGYHFAKWSDGDTNSPREVVVTSDSTFTAIFEPHYYDENGFCPCGKSFEPVADVDDDGYYDIANAGQLYSFMMLINGDKANATAKAVLTDDIVINENLLKAVAGKSVSSDCKVWTPISVFKGVLDGKGHSISGLYCNLSSENNVALIGENQGIVKNLGIKDSYFEGSDNVASLCATITSDGMLNNCYNEGVVKGVNNVGGLCGTNEKGVVMKSHNVGKVEGTTDNIGGVCGVNNASVYECYNEGAIKGSHNNVGGVCGKVSGEKSALYNCYNVGDVNGFNYVGGICGENDGATVANNFNVGEMVCDGIAKSICASNSGIIDNCFYDDEIGDELATKKPTEEFYDGNVALLLHNYKAGTVSGAIWGQDANKNLLPDFSGIVIIKSDVSDILSDDAIVEIVYYNVNGQRLARPQIGVNVVLVRYQSGRVESVKQIVRE